MPKVDIWALDQGMCLEIPTLHRALMLSTPSKTKEQTLLLEA
jgi:hypothetical protein